MSGDRGSVLHLEGESPMAYYDRASRLIVRAGAVLQDVRVAGDFSVDVPLPASAEPVTIVIETDQTHVPAERSWRGSADRRRLGLRIYRCELRPIAPASGRDTAASFPQAR
jgi:hypothetical protein